MPQGETRKASGLTRPDPPRTGVWEATTSAVKINSRESAHPTCNLDGKDRHFARSVPNGNPRSAGWSHFTPPSAKPPQAAERRSECGEMRRSTPSSPECNQQGVESSGEPSRLQTGIARRGSMHSLRSAPSRIARSLPASDGKPASRSQPLTQAPASSHKVGW